MGEIIRLLKRDWPKLLLIMALFTLGILIGEQLTEVNPKMAAEFKDEAMRKFEEIAGWMENLPPGAEFFVIWINNITASLATILFGLLLPIYPLASLLMNGVIIGLFQNMIQVESGLSPFLFYLSLTPHGILELPAFFIAVLLGIRFGLVPYRLILHYLRTKEHLPLFKEVTREARSYGILIVIMLLFAAVIEMTISPLLLRLLSGR
ncbi:MAG: stage II sporulation protein M [Firmicutes bacterium]|nr:stage II sporulation protein M [Bacillota bacterium]